MRKLSTITTFLLLAAGIGCAHTLIEGTEIRDTKENRAVMAVLDELQEGIRARDAEAIISLVSPAYFEDNGTPNPHDDYGFDELNNKVLPESLAVAKEIFLSFEIHDIVVDDDQAHADVRYASRAKLDLPSGTLWDSHREFNRIILAREDDAWRIVSGL